jgi:hypothetical protein
MSMNKELLIGIALGAVGYHLYMMKMGAGA